ncbi:MAG: hypothetical protein QOI43_1573 [Gaiellales bacterium]|nr:hypothetical protein [Gaiellales bacterium]
MLKPTVFLTALALVVAPTALAAKPITPKNPNAAPKAHAVTFVLHGTLSHFTAANGATPGAITILVSKANHHGAALKGQTLTFALSASSKVVFDSDKQLTDGERGLVKVRAPKKTDATVLQTISAGMVIDQGAATP